MLERLLRDAIAIKTDSFPIIPEKRSFMSSVSYILTNHELSYQSSFACFRSSERCDDSLKPSSRSDETFHVAIVRIPTTTIVFLKRTKETQIINAKKLAKKTVEGG